MGATADIRGLKRVCAECGIRFYDMNKRPIVCPGCATEFTGDFATKTRRTKADEKAIETKEALKKEVANTDEDDEDEDIDSEVDVVSLDDPEDFPDDDIDQDNDEDDDDLDLDDDITGLGDLGKDLSDIDDEDDDFDDIDDDDEDDKD